MKLKPKHLQELERSAIAPELMARHFYSVDEAFEEMAYALPANERRNDGRLREKWLKKYGKPGWVCRGVDPDNPSELMEWGCFKPDTPYRYWDKEKGKEEIRKYEHPVQTPTRAFMFGDGWGETLADPSEPLNATEGGKKTVCLESHGRRAIGLPGINAGYRTPKDKNGKKIGNPHLIPDLEKFDWDRREVTLWFDRDEKIKTFRNVVYATKTIGKLLQEKGAIVSVAMWNGKIGKGIDDFIANGGQWEDVEIVPLSNYCKRWGILDLDHLAQWLESHNEENFKTLSIYDFCNSVYWIARHIGADLDIVKSLLKTFKKRYFSYLNNRLTEVQVLLTEKAIEGTMEALELGEERGIYLLNAQKATGKTSITIQSIIDQAKQNDDSVLMLVPTRFLSRDSANNLGLTCHLDEDKATDSNYVIACPESLHKFYDSRRWDSIIIDEANEVLPRVWQGTLGKAPEQSKLAFDEFLQEARSVILSQDGLYRPIVRSVARVSGINAQRLIARRRSPSKIEIVRYLGNEKPDDWDTSMPKGSGRIDWQFASWMKQIEDAIERGEKIAIPCGSRAKARQIFRLIREKYRDKKVTICDGRDSFGGLRSAIAQDVNGWISENQPDVLIWTPVFNSGISITVPYFTIQFEYVSPFETASMASQRGERVRAALGGGLVKQRHVFIQTKGLPSDPPIETFTADYWLDILAKSSANGKRSTMKQLASLGLNSLKEGIEKTFSSPCENHPKLAEVLAIQAREIHLKVQCLEREWLGNGWDIVEPQQCDKAYAVDLSSRTGWVKEDILDVRSRTYAKAIGYLDAKERGKFKEAIANFEAGQEPAGPIEAARHHRWKIEKTMNNYLLLNDPDWWAAFGNDPHVLAAMRLRCLVMMPDEDFNTLVEWATLLTIGKHVEGMDRPPMLPVSFRELGKAALLRSCPHFREILINIDDAVWNHHDERIAAIRQWTIANAAKLAAMTKHNQRWYGLTFNDRLAPVKHLHKLLFMVGYDTHKDERSRRGDRWYRAKRISDYSLDGIEDPLKLKKAERAKYKAEKQGEVMAAIEKAIASPLESAIVCEAWQTFKAELGGGSEGQKEILLSTSGDAIAAYSQPSEVTFQPDKGSFELPQIFDRDTWGHSWREGMKCLVNGVSQTIKAVNKWMVWIDTGGEKYERFKVEELQSVA